MNGRYKTVVHGGRRYFVVGKDGLIWVPDESEVRPEPTALGKFWRWIKASDARFEIVTGMVTLAAFGVLIWLLHHFFSVAGLQP